ncbi:PREDICTED: D(4) dopamine receptor-like [Branchiostoma belcheri]|uniref:D(4) dopamine receptor-like n=1 Tax=Branchiostoma belcheri TaxID=7741 RepID=A0A6P5A8H9_BRABE|nr:PREDICTED: D(4) dopamine receptor-like [Branchiostoma belcheri]XP_019638051.1 PREDICTED: D(4) dopamine receptor-like [Branchiostoma belcheri]
MEGNATVYPSVAGFDVPRSPGNDSAAGWNGTDWGEAAGSYNFVALLPILVIVEILTGNALVVVAIYKGKNLRSTTNYFIVNLAVTDALMAVLVMPFVVYVEFINGVWQLGFLMCDVFVALDVMLCTASIFNLVAISIDRFYAVTWPVRYSKHKSNNRLAITITLVWTLSFGISAPLLFGSNYPATGERSPEMCGIFNTNYMIYSSMCSFFIPCTAMLVLYYKILKKIKERSKKMAKKMPKSTSAGMVCEDTVIAHTTTSSGIAMKENGASKKTLSTPVLDGHAVSVVDANSRPSSESDISVAMAAETNQSDEAVRTPRGTKLPKTRLDAIKSKLKGKAKDEFPNRREQKAINVMKIVIGVFLICWTPFFVTNVVRACSTCTIPDTLFSIVTWLGYLNSGMNPIIYTIFNEEFRIAFRKLLCKGQGR